MILIINPLQLVNGYQWQFRTSCNITSMIRLQNGNLVIDNIFRENTAYTYDVTDYLSAQILISENNKNGLLASQPAPGFSTTFNRLLISDATISKTKLQLVLYYLSIQ